LSSLKKITVTQFRNFDFETFYFNAKVTGITGLNGAGKTNLLDAIYYLCYTKSYFQGREINNVKYETNGFRIEGAFDHETIICKWKEGKKSIEHDGIVYEKITEHIGKYSAVMIAPDDIELINDGSELRRKFMDGLLSQSDATYLEYLLLYQKILSQRNAYLKQTSAVNISHDLLDIYDEQLALYGSYLIQERKRLSAQLPEWVQAYYAALSKDAEVVNVLYKNSAEAENLKTVLTQSRRKDLEYKRTLVGPHTDDWAFLIGDNPMKAHASQGQKKSFLISLKLAHIKWLQLLDKTPFLLLDDIFEKLDRKRLLRLFEMLGQFAIPQIFLTHTSEEDMLETVQQFYSDVQMIRL
jgi:DNA replication and repair protein RecF